MVEDAASQSPIQLQPHIVDRAAMYLQFLESEAASKLLREPLLIIAIPVPVLLKSKREVVCAEDSIAAPGELSPQQFLEASLQLKPLDDLYLSYQKGKGGQIRYQACCRRKSTASAAGPP